MISTGLTNAEWIWAISLFLTMNLVLVIDYFENKHSNEVYTRKQVKNHFIVANVAFLVFFILVYFKDSDCSTEKSDINQSKIEQRLDRIEQKLDHSNQNEKSTKDKDCDCN